MLKTAWVLVSLLLFATHAAAQVSIETQDVGEIYQAGIGQSTILFTNAGDRPVQILSVSPAAKDDSVGDFKLPATVAPKTSVNIPVTVASGMEAGEHRHAFDIRTDDPAKPRMQASVHLFVLSVLDEAAPKIDLGAVDTNAPAAAKSVALSSREVPDFRITRIVEVPDFVTAKILPDGRTVAIAGKTDASWGRHAGLVKVALNSAVQPQAWIQVQDDVHGEVIPSQNPVDLGLFRNPNASFIVQFKSRDGKPVRLGKVAIEGVPATVAKEACAGGKPDCTQVRAKLTAVPEMGRMVGKLLVELPELHRQLPIDVYGWYLPESVKTRSLDEAQAKGGKSSTEPPPLDLKSALQKSTAVAPPPMADPPGHGPLLKWQVSNENNIYGYLIYRSDAEKGPFLRVNKEIVRVEGDKGDGITSSYAWRDDSATAGKTYWYYVGMLNRDGSKQQLSGPQEVKAK
ncbi:MAG: hypothetical protein JSS28_08845 [Proteobacteria bacterium]|nr:hypothetical protein [Pseudomonadota bacterium]